jgi:hypothetical protein
VHVNGIKVPGTFSAESKVAALPSSDEEELCHHRACVTQNNPIVLSTISPKRSRARQALTLAALAFSQANWMGSARTR